MKYKERPMCGAHLDYGEKCDCEKREARTAETARTSNANKKIPYHYDTTKREVCQ